MAKVPKRPKAVMTPGSYRLPPQRTTPAKEGDTSKAKTTPSKAKTTPSKAKTTPSKAKTILNKTRKAGRPFAKKQGKKKREKIRHRSGYTEVDLMEAIRLCKEEDFSIKAASTYVNSVKQNPVPRHVSYEIMNIAGTVPVCTVLYLYINLFCNFENCMVTVLVQLLTLR
jgi:hypothetical protein